MRWLESDSGLEIDPHEVDAASKSGRFFRLIDCREEDEFQICRLPGSELVPLGWFPQRHDLALSDEPMVIYCHHGMRSLQAVRFLRGRGRTRVYSMRGGIDAWSQSVDPNMPRY